MNADSISPLERLVQARSGIEAQEMVSGGVRDAMPAVERPVSAHEISVLGLIEMLLKEPRRADALSRRAQLQHELLPRFLGISLAGYTLFCAAMILILNSAPPAALPRHWLPMPAARWADASALGLFLGYTLGLVASAGICLPSFYFFGLLAGTRMSFLQITGQLVRAQASGVLTLVGLLPVYVALVLGLVVFNAPAELLELCLYLGLALPFIAGLEGVRAICRGIQGMAQSLPPEIRCRRECFLRRLTLSWSACYTVVCPVMIYRLWEFIAGKAL